MKNKILFVLCLLTGLMFINSGLNKYFNYMPMPKDMPEKAKQAGMAFMAIGWLMPLVGAAEIIGGLLLIFKKTRALGAVVLFPVMLSIMLANINMAVPSGMAIAGIMFAVILWAIADNWNKYRPMIQG